MLLAGGYLPQIIVKASTAEVKVSTGKVRVTAGEVKVSTPVTDVVPAWVATWPKCKRSSPVKVSLVAIQRRWIRMS